MNEARSNASNSRNCRSKFEGILREQKSQRGFSLIELMVAMVIGLVMSLAVYGVLASSEGRKRTTTSVNDVDQAASYAVYQLDKYIRSAGSGFTGGVAGSQAFTTTYGCPLRLAKAGTDLLPVASFSISPFKAVTGGLRMLPILILDGAAPNGDDVIITMAGNAGLSELGTDLTAVPTSSSLTLKNVVSFKPSDIILLANKTSIAPCVVEQVDKTFNPAAGETLLPLAGDYFKQVISGSDFSQFNVTSSANATALNLGQQPTMSMFAVGENNDTLFRYNLLAPEADSSKDDPNPGAFVEGIYRMHAIYGIDPTNTNQITWVPPTGNYSAAKLTDGTTTARDRLRSIKAIRIGVVAKAALPEKKNVSAATLLLFSNSPVNAQVTVNLTPLNYRYKTFEATIPLRNALL